MPADMEDHTEALAAELCTSPAGTPQTLHRTHGWRAAEAEHKVANIKTRAKKTAC